MGLDTLDLVSNTQTITQVFNSWNNAQNSLFGRSGIWPSDFPWEIFWNAVLSIDPSLPSPYGEYKNFDINSIYEINGKIYIRLLRNIPTRYYLIFEYDQTTYTLDPNPIILPEIIREYYTNGAAFVQTTNDTAYIWGDPALGGKYNYKYATTDNISIGQGTTTAGFGNSNKLVFHENIVEVISNDYAFIVLGNRAVAGAPNGMKILAAWGDPSRGGKIDTDIRDRIEQNVMDNGQPIMKITATTDSFAILLKNGSIIVWGGLQDNIVVLDSCGFETGATILDPYQYFIDIFSTKSHFLFMHAGSQRITKTIIPSVSNTITHIENYLYGQERIIKWNLNPRLDVNYTFLENTERCWLAENVQEILIEKIFNHTYYQNTNEATFTSHNIPLDSFHPTKLMVLVPKRSDAALRNDFSNYTNWENMDSDPKFDTAVKIINRENYETYSKDIITGVQIFINKNKSRLKDNKIGSYFSTLQKHQHNFSFDDSGIPVYSFCLNPKDVSPSGAINFSELNNILLKVETIPVDQFICNVFVIDTYMIQYNVLTIVGGVGGLKFGN